MFVFFRRFYRDRSANFLAFVSFNFAGLALFFKAIAYVIVFDSFLTIPNFYPEISPMIWLGFFFGLVSVLCDAMSVSADSVLEDRENLPHPEYLG